MQILRPMPPYFYLRVPKIKQKERREKIGSLFLPPNFVWMKRNLQCGEILAIGVSAQKSFPEAKVGQIAIIYHGVEAQAYGEERMRAGYYIDEDETYIYYLATGINHEGRRNEVYAVWNGKNIIVHKDYVFLEVPKDDTAEINLELQSNLAGEGLLRPNMGFIKSSGGLILPKERKKSREELTIEMKENTDRIKQLSKTNRMNREVVEEIHKIERENNKLSAQINHKCYEPFIIAHCNKSFGSKPGTTAYCLNIAAQTIIEFMGKEFIVINSDYIALTLDNSLEVLGNHIRAEP